MTITRELAFDADGGRVSAILDAPAHAWAGFVFAHGAGAGMRHPFMGSVAAGLAFFGFPLHPAGKPSDERAAHLFDVRVPMLFLQGTRDALADLDLLRPLVKKLGRRATLHVVAEGDHSFRVSAKTGVKPADVMNAILDTFGDWARRITRD